MPVQCLLLTPLVHLAHVCTEPGLDEAFDPVGLPGDWWIRTLPCTQEAVILCGRGGREGKGGREGGRGEGGGREGGERGEGGREGGREVIAVREG